MSGITLCNNASCPLSSACGRYQDNAKASRYWQSYALFVPNEIGGCWRCNEYIAREVRDEEG